MTRIFDPANREALFLGALESVSHAGEMLDILRCYSGKTIGQVASELEVVPATIFNWHEGVFLRKLSDAKLDSYIEALDIGGEDEFIDTYVTLAHELHEDLPRYIREQGEGKFILAAEQATNRGELLGAMLKYSAKLTSGLAGHLEVEIEWVYDWASGGSRSLSFLDDEMMQACLDYLEIETDPVVQPYIEGLWGSSKDNHHSSPVEIGAWIERDGIVQLPNQPINEDGAVSRLGAGRGSLLERVWGGEAELTR